ncbi:SDR family oxidoreductase [Streptomyces aculeolatus]
MNPTYDFTGQAAFITGASSGMGLAAARAFAEAGAAVALADIDENAVAGAARDLTGAGHRALALVCDVTREDHVAAAVDRTVEAFGRLDMAYNNAGIMAPPTDAADETAEQFDRVNAVSPGTISTPTVARGELDRARAETGQAIDRLGTAEEVAQAVLWLCSPGAAYVTGVALPVDGGYTAQ